MVLAWYMDSSDADPRLEHHYDPPKFITIEELSRKTGVRYCKIDADHYEDDQRLLEIMKELKIGHRDFLELSKGKTPDYEEKAKMLYREHLHSEEEARLTVEGSAYYDVRDKEDRWIRVQPTKGDLIIFPTGIYHRFTLDTKNYVKILRLFVDQDCWTSISRPADDHPARQDYLNNMNSK